MFWKSLDFSSQDFFKGFFSPFYHVFYFSPIIMNKKKEKGKKKQSTRKAKNP